jgi:outer membrane receptor protein involved in Fe transport
VTESAPVDASADNAAGGAATTERVVVTGSYIPTAETESALPVTVYTSTVLQKQGANTPVEGLRQLPSFVGNASTENDSNGGNGAAFINLRAIGQQNTLILINGRRAFATSNVNIIPIGALSRSEILKEGASAVYGSDAVAGVVNFILLNGPGEAPYEGAEVDFLYGNTTDTDARVLQTYIRGGVATDKVSIAAAAQYYDRDGLFSRDRDVSASADRRFLGGNNGGSPTFPGRVSARTTPGNEGAPLLPGPPFVPTPSSLSIRARRTSTADPTACSIRQLASQVAARTLTGSTSASSHRPFRRSRSKTSMLPAATRSSAKACRFTAMSSMDIRSRTTGWRQRRSTLALRS